MPPENKVEIVIDESKAETFCRACSQRVRSERRTEPSSVARLATCSRRAAARPARRRALLARATHCLWCPPPARRSERCPRSGRCEAPPTSPPESSPPASQVPLAHPATRPLQTKYPVVCSSGILAGIHLSRLGPGWVH